MQAYIFYREQGFYTLDLKDDNDAIANAVYNEGTLKVTDLAGACNMAKNNSNMFWKLKNKSGEFLGSPIGWWLALIFWIVTFLITYFS